MKAKPEVDPDIKPELPDTPNKKFPSLRWSWLTKRRATWLGIAIVVLLLGLIFFKPKNEAPKAVFNPQNFQKNQSKQSGATTPRPCVAASDDRYYRTDRSLVVDPKNSNNLFVGVEYKGAYQSTDGGTTWKQTMKDIQWPNYCFPEPFYAAISPADSKTMYLTANGSGIIKTSNSGASWKLLYNSNMFPRTEEFSFDPTNAQIIYATAENSRNASTNPQDISNVTKGLVYKSTDGGTTWTELTTPLAADAGNDAIVVSKDDPKHILAFTLLLKYANTTSTSTQANGRQPDLSGQLGILESKDAGKTWTSLHTIPSDYEAVVYAYHSESNPKNIYVTPFSASSTQPKGFASTDFGQTWTASTYMNYVAYDPFDASGNHAIGFSSQVPPDAAGHLFETNDAGRTWHAYGSLPAEITNMNDHKTLISNIQWDGKAPNTIYMSGASALVWRSTDSGKTWTNLLSLSKLPAN